MRLARRHHAIRRTIVLDRLSIRSKLVGAFAMLLTLTLTLALGLFAILQSRYRRR